MLQVNQSVSLLFFQCLYFLLVENSPVKPINTAVSHSHGGCAIGKGHFVNPDGLIVEILTCKLFVISKCLI